LTRVSQLRSTREKFPPCPVPRILPPILPEGEGAAVGGRGLGLGSGSIPDQTTSIRDAHRRPASRHNSPADYTQTAPSGTAKTPPCKSVRRSQGSLLLLLLLLPRIHTPLIHDGTGGGEEVNKTAFLLLTTKRGKGSRRQQRKYHHRGPDKSVGDGHGSPGENGPRRTYVRTFTQYKMSMCGCVLAGQANPCLSPSLSHLPWHTARRMEKAEA
jgi:hypothetical protein